MAKISAKDGLILIGGYSLSTFASEYNLDYKNNIIEVTGFTDGWKNYIPGERQGKMVLNMYWDSDTNSVNDALSGLAKKCVTVVPEGGTVGENCFTIYAEQSNFAPQGSHDSALTVGNIEFQASGIDGGPLPAQLLQNATITDTTSSTGVDDPSGAGVTQRCAGVLHIYTPCASDTYEVLIEHADTQGGAYSTLVTFTLDGSARASQMIQVASGAIKRWRRVTATRTGAAADNFGFAVAFWHAGI
jgi:hypothetical protein